MGKDKFNAFFEGKEFINEEKSEEEIRRYTLEENLGELKRVKKILKSGDGIQKTAIYGNMKSYFEWKHEDAFPIFESLINELFSQAPEAQIEAGRGLKNILTKQIPVIDQWIEVFENFLSHVNFAKYEKTINDEFFKLSGITSPSINKATSMRILGIMLKVKKGQLSSQMIEMAQLFSQIGEFEIKQRLLNYVIEYIFIYLPKEELEKYWNDKLLDFLQDANVQIKCASIQIVSRILDKLSESFKGNKIKILFFDLINTKQNQVKLTFSHYIGPFIYHLRQVLEQKPANQSVIFSTLQEYCESSESEIRVNFLYNLPCILQVYGKKIWPLVNKQFYNMLLRDEIEEVRIQAINVYVHVIEFIGKAESKNLIKQHMKIIINDDASQPKNYFVKILPSIFNLYKDDVKANRQFFSEILKEFLDILENQINSPNWRFLLSVINFIEQDFSLFDSFEMNDLYFPIIFQAMLKGCTEVRKAALHTIVKYLEENSNKNDRDAVISYISNNFYLVRSYQQKHGYVQFVEILLDKFDSTYFRNYKFINTLNFQLDKVPQLRRYLTRLLSPIYDAITSPVEKDQFNKLLEACKSLLQDKDLKIQELTQKAIDQISLDDPHFMEKVNSYLPPNPNISRNEIKSANYIADDFDSEYNGKQSRKPSEKVNLVNSKISLTSNPVLRKNYQNGSMVGVTSSTTTSIRNSSGNRLVTKTTIGSSTRSNAGSISQLPSMTSPATIKKVVGIPIVPASNVTKKYSLPEGIPKKSDLVKPAGTGMNGIGTKPLTSAISQQGVGSKIVPTKINSQNIQSFSNIGKINGTSIKPNTSIIKK